MHTFYITGGLVNDRLAYITHICDELGVSSYDTHRLIPKEESPTIGISDIRGWQKELFLTPLNSPYTIGVIPNAELLTIEAQNALLKTLEEPPTHTRIYIESQTSSSLLPTILSRCQMIQLITQPASDTTAKPSVATMRDLCDDTMSPGKKIALLEKEITNKEEAKVWVIQAIHTLHTHHTEMPSTTYLPCMQGLLTASQHLSANVSYKLAIDELTFLKIH